MGQGSIRAGGLARQRGPRVGSPYSAALWEGHGTSALECLTRWSSPDAMWPRNDNPCKGGLPAGVRRGKESDFGELLPIPRNRMAGEAARTGYARKCHSNNQKALKWSAQTYAQEEAPAGGPSSEGSGECVVEQLGNHAAGKNLSRKAGNFQVKKWLGQTKALVLYERPLRPLAGRLAGTPLVGRPCRFALGSGAGTAPGLSSGWVLRTA